MKTKGEKTRKYILDKSIELFAEKGYLAVTMKDVCEKCDMSRGGVYRYFSSTKEIFIEMLDQDIELNRKVVEDCINNNIPAERILEGYFNQEIENIFSKNNGLFFAVHEFAFAETDQRENLNRRVDNSIKIIVSILKYGQQTKEFREFDTDSVATHYIYFMDSLKTSSSILKLSRDEVNSQIRLLKEMIV